MAEAESVRPFPGRPREVVIRVSESGDVGFTPRELRMIREQVGKSWTELVQDDERDADRWMVQAWLKLRREGHDLSWDDMEDMVIRLEVDVDVEIDPTSGRPRVNLPGSATSTDSTLERSSS